MYRCSCRQTYRSVSFHGRLALTLACLCLLWPSAGLAQRPWPSVTLDPVYGGFTVPVFVTHSGDATRRLFVVEQTGVIRVIRDGVLLDRPFLDLSSTGAQRVLFSGERGLLSMAFPPGFAAKQYFYVYYTMTDGNNLVARYHVDPGDADVADPATEEPILTFIHPRTNHNGGQLAFSPHDGYLYIGTGDGGGGGDPDRNGQNPQTLLGKILRIDTESSVQPYGIPADNPFVGEKDPTDQVRDEIWALGLRNPWRFGFDRLTGDLYVGDVGQARFEEVDFQPASSTGGENYGWNILEGNSCYNTGSGPLTCVPPPDYAAPVAVYEHPTGNAVTGGYVYRGPRSDPALLGIYFFADFGSGKLWGLKRSGGQWNMQLLLETGLSVSTFGEDEVGRIYLADYATGDIYLLRHRGARPPS